MAGRLSRRRLAAFLALVVAATAAVVAVRACAGPDPRELLGRLEPASSGVVRIEADVRLAGLAALAGPLQLTLEGPFAGSRPGAVPRLDLAGDAAALRRRVDGGLVVTAGRTFIRYEGDAYALEPADDRRLRAAYLRALEALPPFLRRIHPGPFDPGPRARIADDEEAGGERLTRVEGPLDVHAAVRVVSGVLDALRAADPAVPRLGGGERRRIAEALREARWAVSVAGDDTVRRAEVTALVDLPADLRARLGGVPGGTVTVVAAYRELGRPQRIEAPPNPLPARLLEARLGELTGDGARGTLP